jgi:hypothetical protein
MPKVDPIIGMNFNSSQMELVQSWGRGHSSRLPHKNLTKLNLSHVLATIKMPIGNTT